MNFKKNTLTRVTALIYLVGFAIVFYLVLRIADPSAAGGGGVFGQIAYVVIGAFGIIIPFVFMGVMLISGFMQIGFSIVKWKELTTLDKVVFGIILVSFLFVAFVIGYNILVPKIEYNQNSKILQQAKEQDNPNLCEEVKDQSKATKDNEALERCYRYFAIKRQDYSICEDRGCFTQLALILKDPFVCEKMSTKTWVYDFFIDDCYDQVIDQLWGTIENKENICSSIEFKYEKNREWCFSRIELEK